MLLYLMVLQLLVWVETRGSRKRRDTVPWGEINAVEFRYNINLFEEKENIYSHWKYI